MLRSLWWISRLHLLAQKFCCPRPCLLKGCSALQDNLVLLRVYGAGTAPICVAGDTSAMLLKCTGDLRGLLDGLCPGRRGGLSPGGAGLGCSLLSKHNLKCRRCGLRWYCLHFSEPAPLGWAWPGLQEEEVGRSGHHISSKTEQMRAVGGTVGEVSEAAAAIPQLGWGSYWR